MIKLTLKLILYCLGFLMLFSSVSFYNILRNNKLFTLTKKNNNAQHSAQSANN